MYRFESVFLIMFFDNFPVIVSQLSEVPVVSPTIGPKQMKNALKYVVFYR